MSCEHSLADQDLAAHWDGKCPLCLERRLAQATALLREARGRAWHPLEAEWRARIDAYLSAEGKS